MNPIASLAAAAASAIRGDRRIAIPVVEVLGGPERRRRSPAGMSARPCARSAIPATSARPGTGCGRPRVGPRALRSRRSNRGSPVLRVSLWVYRYEVPSPATDASSGSVLTTNRSACFRLSHVDRSSLITPCCRNAYRQVGRCRIPSSSAGVVTTRSACDEMSHDALSIRSRNSRVLRATTRSRRRPEADVVGGLGADGKPGVDVGPMLAEVLEQSLGVVVGLVRPIHQHPGIPEAGTDDGTSRLATYEAGAEACREPARRTIPAAEPRSSGPSSRASRSTRARRCAGRSRGAPDGDGSPVELEHDGAVQRQPQDPRVQQGTPEVDVRLRLRPRRLDRVPLERHGLRRLSADEVEHDAWRRIAASTSVTAGVECQSWPRPACARM